VRHGVECTYAELRSFVELLRHDDVDARLRLEAQGEAVLFRARRGAQSGA
jgi:hypothetical protein